MAKLRGRFINKYLRKKNWDYNSSGSYFITICTKDKKSFFGEVIDEKMILTNIGMIANDDWEKSVKIRPDMNLTLGAYVVMPDHFHGIITIGSNEFNGRSAMHRGSVMHHGPTYKNKFSYQSKNLSSIIGGFKGAVTIYARKNNIEFGWQDSFHDRIIRDHDEYVRITKYIEDNPKNWKKNR